ncbi:MAG: hypothetical protein P8176_14960 [Gammaproteobacteria bacterium]
MSQYHYITAKNGLGYWLGIIGSSMMLLLLTYSMRKRFKALRGILSTRFWLRIHMLLGVVGPLLVIFHSNFSLGSLNSTVALVSMLLVAGSGLIGRYLYSNIRTHFYGEKIKLGQLREEFKQLNEIATPFVLTEQQQLNQSKALAIIDTIFQNQAKKASVIQLFRQRRSAKKELFFVKKFLNHLEKNSTHQAQSEADRTRAKLLQQHIGALIRILNKLPSLQLCERLFSLWHVVHLPIFALMLLTAATHIFVVHLY